MHSTARKTVTILGAIVMASAVARAQPGDPTADPLGDVLEASTQAVPDAVIFRQNASHPLSANDQQLFRQAVESGRRGDVNGARNAIAAMTDSLARKAATWVLVDTSADSLGFLEVDAARRDMADWPRAAKRQAAAERLVEASGKTPQQIADWFLGNEPTTAQGAMALASAERGLGKTAEAAALIRHWWRDKPFDVDAQRTMQARFADVLTPDDNIRRADILLYGPASPAAREMVGILPADLQKAAAARMALREDKIAGTELVAELPAELAVSPGVAFERAAYLRRKGQDGLALELAANFPKDVGEAGDRVWKERHYLVLSALKSGDAKLAYAAAADCGLPPGADAADAEFYAGWIALTRLNDPERAARHFRVIETFATSAITRGRALYWLGRTADARHDREGAERHYGRAAQYYTTFYGQLAAEKLGHRLQLGADPVITSDLRARFEGRDTIQATRLFNDAGLRDLFRTFVMGLDDTLPTAEDEALLIDMARGYGDQELSMKVARAAAQRGFVLPQRAYPFRNPPEVAGGPEPALVLAITRQESGFDPTIRSGAGARGMMQLMPSTAVIVARKTGVSYSPARLDEADYNMRLGSTYLGQLVDRFSGSYVMATAGYNAGPGRPIQWSSFCGDPRGGATDPIDFIECIPFSETRNYVMRVLENVQVYRAKLNGGSAPITLSVDLRRGAYGYSSSRPVAATAPLAS